VLEWEAGAQIDFDLHVAHPAGDFYGPLDCWHQTPRHEWCDPGLDGDARHGGDGDEVIEMRGAPPGWYRAAAELFRGPGQAQFTFQCGDRPPQRFGPRLIVEGERGGRPLWIGFRFDPTTCEAELLDELVGEDPCRDVECPEGQFCDPERNGDCIDIREDAPLCAECAASPECGDGALCIRYEVGDRCAPRCGERGACPDGAHCERLGNAFVCIHDASCVGVAPEGASPWPQQSPPLCRRDNDCVDGEECRFLREAGGLSVCGLGCRRNRDCPDAFFCCDVEGAEPLCVPDGHPFARFCED